MTTKNDPIPTFSYSKKEIPSKTNMDFIAKLQKLIDSAKEELESIGEKVDSFLQVQEEDFDEWKTIREEKERISKYESPPGLVTDDPQNISKTGNLADEILEKKLKDNTWFEWAQALEDSTPFEPSRNDDYIEELVYGDAFIDPNRNKSETPYLDSFCELNPGDLMCKEFDV